MVAQVIRFARQRPHEGIPLQDLVLAEVDTRAGTAADITRRVAGHCKRAAARRGEPFCEVPTEHGVRRILLDLEAHHLVARQALGAAENDVWHATAPWPPEAA